MSSQDKCAIESSPERDFGQDLCSSGKSNESDNDRHDAPRRLVIKVGSSTLTTSDSQIDYQFLDSLVAQIAAAKSQGWQPVLVTSAAIACGLEALGIKDRPQDMPSLQAAASVGQSALSSAYADAFARYSLLTSLVLLTRRDTADRLAYLHARDTLNRLLDLDVVPIVNENDTVSVEQIRFGDNDTLAALVACLIDADLLVILSDIEGLYDKDPRKYPDAQLLHKVHRITPDIVAGAGGVGSHVGSGGMITKIKAAQVLMAAGIPMVVCYGRTPDIILEAIHGDPVGTLFSSTEKPHEITPKKLWLALGDAVHGTLTVDEGAKRALVSGGSSLLWVGIKDLEGKFSKDDIVDIQDENGYQFARGKIAVDSDLLKLAIGLDRETVQKNSILTSLADGPVIHRDELVIFE